MSHDYEDGNQLPSVPAQNTMTQGQVAILLVGLTRLMSPHGEFADNLKQVRDPSEVVRFFERVETSVVPAVEALASAIRNRGEPVVWVRPLIARSDAADWPRAISAKLVHHGFAPCKPGMASWELLPGLTCRPHDYQIATKAPSSFWGGNTDVILRNRGTKHVLVAGTLTNYSVLINAVDASQRGYQVTIVEDGTAALTDVDHRQALFQHPYRCSVGTSTQLLQSLRAPASLAAMDDR